MTIKKLLIIIAVLAVVVFLAVVLLKTPNPPPSQTASVGDTTALNLDLQFENNFTDASGRLNQVSCSGAACPTFAAGSGHLSTGAYSFDGTNNFLTVGNASALNLTDDFTLSTWIKTNSNIATDEWQGILVKGDGNDNARTWGLYLGYNTVQIHWKNKDWQFLTAPISNIQPNTWHHIVYTRAGTSQKIYVNGVSLPVSGSSLPMLINTSPLYIGGHASVSEERFNGVIDNVRIFGRVLSATEIATLYQEKIESKMGLKVGQPVAPVAPAQPVNLRCVASVVGAWKNSWFSSQGNLFTFKFDVTPLGANLDGLIGLSPATASTFGNLAAIVRFNNTGTIDAWNQAKSGYSSDTSVSYSANTIYHVRMAVNLAAQKYSVYVTAPGQAEKLLGSNYTFRSTAGAPTSFNNLAIWSNSVPGTGINVCNLNVKTDSAIVTPPPPVVIIPPTPTTTPPIIVSQTKLTPIARWDTVPYQRIDASNPLNLAVVAFSKYGIKQVVFKISGGGYTGGNKVATTMSLNPQTNVWEYWVPLTASEFTTNGTTTINAEVYGNDGGVRTATSPRSGEGLGALTLVVTPQATAGTKYERFYAWVSPGASGGSVSNISADPGTYYGSVKAAAAAIQSKRSTFGDTDGAVIYLKAGTYSSAGSGSAVKNTSEWLTVTAAPGLAKDQVVITAPYTFAGLSKVFIKRLTLKSLGQWSMVIQDKDIVSLWIDDAKLLGSGRAASPESEHGTEAVYFNVAVDNKWFTNSFVYDSKFGVSSGAVLARNLTLDLIGNDPFVNVPLIINSKVSRVYPSPWNSSTPCNVFASDGTDGGCRHADLVQMHSGIYTKNIIIYGLKGNDLQYDGIFFRSANGSAQTPFDGVALVNNSVDVSSSRTPFALYGVYNHVLLWNNTFGGRSNNATYFDDENCGKTCTSQFAMTNSSMRGNEFTAIFDWTGNNTWETLSSIEWLNNHYQYPQLYAAYRTFAPDSGTSTKSTGDPKLVTDPANVNFGHPAVGSPLLNRVKNSPAPADLDGRVRSQTSATVGAFE